MNGAIEQPLEAEQRDTILKAAKYFNGGVWLRQAGTFPTNDASP